MARALRIQCPGGRYHPLSPRLQRDRRHRRGNERREIFWDDTDRFRFLELLSELAQRFGSRVHAYVLMDNHYHLLLETPESNLSRVMQWCNVSYSVWFNLRHRRSGHLLQGRFGADLVQEDAGWQEVARYVHLNPIRVARLGLDKSARAASGAGPITAPSAELVAERLRTLREYRWSSYPEQIKGESWIEFAERHGDWGRDAALWLGRCAGRLRLAELGRRVGNLDYAVVSKAVARFEQRLRADPHCASDWRVFNYDCPNDKRQDTTPMSYANMLLTRASTRRLIRVDAP